MTATDRYPTRKSTGLSPFPRRDPVVHPGAKPYDPVLDPVQLARFETDGFVRFDRLIDETVIEELVEDLDRLASDEELLASENVILEPSSREIRSIFAIHRLSPTVSKLVADPRILDRVRQILGSEVYIHQSRVNFKPGFEGREFAWHSDFETWHAEDGMPGPRAVSLAIALTANYTCNGSLMLIPGSHLMFVPTAGETPEDHYRTSLRSQSIGVPDHDSLRTLVDTAGGIATVTGEPGSAVIFDCNAMHGSAGNITPYPRSNIFVVYNSVDNALEEPFAAPKPRPSFIASRDFTPVG